APPTAVTVTGGPVHGSPGGSTTTTWSHAADAVVTARSTRRAPFSARNCFGAPNRLPRPAATTIPQTGIRSVLLLGLRGLVDRSGKHDAAHRRRDHGGRDEGHPSGADQLGTAVHHHHGPVVEEADALTRLTTGLGQADLEHLTRVHVGTELDRQPPQVSRRYALDLGHAHEDRKST